MGKIEINAAIFPKIMMISLGKPIKGDEINVTENVSADMDSPDIMIRLC